jgi:hypothetical protein
MVAFSAYRTGWNRNIHSDAFGSDFKRESTEVGLGVYLS